jgi:hypothetical protein
VRTEKGWRIRERVEEFGYNTMTQSVIQPGG